MFVQMAFTVVVPPHETSLSSVQIPSVSSYSSFLFVPLHSISPPLGDLLLCPSPVLGT